MLAMIRIMLILLMPVFALAQINTSVINPVQAKIKILSIADNVIAEDNYTQPESGNKFISVRVLIDNSNSSYQFYSSFLDLKLKDSEEIFFKPSIKSFVVRKPYLASTVVKSEKIINGWVTFEVPHKLSINSLQIKYEKSNHLYSNWIPLWPVVSNSESAQKFKRQVSRKNAGSSLVIKQMLLRKTLQSINDYLNYTFTNQSRFFINGIKNASQAKLLIASFKKTTSYSANNRLNILRDTITLLSDDIPQIFIKRQSAKDMRNFALNLRKMRKVVVVNYLQN